MEKFLKLSRTELRNVKGGDAPINSLCDDDCTTDSDYEVYYGKGAKCGSTTECGLTVKKCSE